MTDREKIEARKRALAEEIKSLPPHERLRLAADLLDRQLPDMALSVAESVTTEIRALIARGRS